MSNKFTVSTVSTVSRESTESNIKTENNVLDSNKISHPNDTQENYSPSTALIKMYENCDRDVMDATLVKIADMYRNSTQSFLGKYEVPKF